MGAHLLNTAAEGGPSVSWWRDGTDEVDFVLHAGAAVVGIEVKSAFSAPPRGLTAFRSRFPRARTLVVGAGSGAVPLEAFLSHPASEWLA